ncbi:MAG: ABC transporter permease [Lachnospiraceae bacterium]|nr:ABC transporter permease [Lachnospiraceae bacterium]
MITNAFRMAKSSSKLLLRSGGFIIIGILIPLAATLLINIWSGADRMERVDSVYELPHMDTQMAYLVNFNCLPVKVYDHTDNDESRGMCLRLAEAGIFQIFRVECSGYSMDEIMDSASESALNDKVGAILILEETMEDSKLFYIGEDARFSLFRDTLKLCFRNPHEENVDSPKVTYVTANSGDDVNYYKIREFSYCIAIASIAFIFGGVLILGTTMTEKQDHVYSRIMLTTATRTSYILSKIILILGLSFIQSSVMTISFVFFVNADIGISVLQFACILFLQGIIFNLLSVCAGLFCNSMSAAAFLAFTMWSISALMAGTYFDISGASDLYKKVALLMPQRWALLAATRFQNSDYSAYPMIFCVTAAYLLVILVVGILGLKLNEEE